MCRNSVSYALTIISSAAQRTVPVGAVTELITFDVYNRGGLLAGTMPASPPVAIVYAFSLSTTFRS